MAGDRGYISPDEVKKAQDAIRFLSSLPYSSSSTSGPPGSSSSASSEPGSNSSTNSAITDTKGGKVILFMYF